VDLHHLLRAALLEFAKHQESAVSRPGWHTLIGIGRWFHFDWLASRRSDSINPPSALGIAAHEGELSSVWRPMRLIRFERWPRELCAMLTAGIAHEQYVFQVPAVCRALAVSRETDIARGMAIPHWNEAGFRNVVSRKLASGVCSDCEYL
jgi:hypothetical protein